MPTEKTDVDHAVDQVTRLARFHLTFFSHVFLQDVFKAPRVHFQLAYGYNVFEDLDVCLGCGRIETRAVSHPPKKSFVHKYCFIKIRRENHELFERHLNLFSVVQRKKVYATLERQDPAVQQVERLDSLTAKVVDHERSAVCFHMKRRLIK